MSGHPRPFGWNVAYEGVTSQSLVPAVVVTVSRTRAGANPLNETVVVQPDSPGHVAVCTLSADPTGAA
jgi:hypothetical protein